MFSITVNEPGSVSPTMPHWVLEFEGFGPGKSMFRKVLEPCLLLAMPLFFTVDGTVEENSTERKRLLLL